MKKTKKYILISLALLIVLGGVAVALLLTQPKTETDAAEESSASSEAEKVLDYALSDVRSIDLTSRALGESYTMVPAKSDKSDGANDTFTIEGWEDEDVTEFDVLSVAERLYSFSAVRELGEVENLADYGLDGDGEIKVVLHLNDGDTTLRIGTKAGESAGRYLLLDGKVYIVTQASKIDQSKYGFINKSNIIAIPDTVETDDEGNEVTDPPMMDFVHLSGKNFPEEIRIDYDENSMLLYIMNEPIYAGASSSRISELIEVLQTVSAQSVAAVKATDEEYARYGLDDPAAVLDYSLNGEEHVIRAGVKHDGAYYAEIDGSGVIYELDGDVVSPWAEADVFKLRDGFIALPQIQQLRRLTITGGGSTEVYEMRREVDEDRTTENNTIYNYYVSLDGKEISYSESFQPFYRDAIAIYALNEEVREPDGEEILRLKFEFYDELDLDPMEIVYYASDSEARRCVATLNGQPSGTVRRSEVEKLLEGKPIVASGELYEPDT